MNFRKYNNITEVIIPNSVQVSTNNFSNIFNNMTNLVTSKIPEEKVVNMTKTYQNCYSLTGSPVCGNNVTNMSSTYNNCRNLTGSPICGNKVTNMYETYRNCVNLTGSPVCGDNVTNMYRTYFNCVNLTGSPICGEKVWDMYSTYCNCINLTGSPVCGNNVFNMSSTYEDCYNITGSPVCGHNVYDLDSTYSSCWSLTGSPVCGDNVTELNWTYYKCYNLTGSPMCGDNVVNMVGAYYGCYNLSGSPVCGDNVIDMGAAYIDCYNITGNPVCGPAVTNMSYTYYNCHNLSGSPVCGDNVTSMDHTYYNCYNLYGEMHMYSNDVSTMHNCFFGRNTSNELIIYVQRDTQSMDACLASDMDDSMVGDYVDWEEHYDENDNLYYHLSYYNISVYPISESSEDGEATLFFTDGTLSGETVNAETFKHYSDSFRVSNSNSYRVTIDGEVYMCKNIGYAYGGTGEDSDSEFCLYNESLGVVLSSWWLSDGTPWILNSSLGTVSVKVESLTGSGNNEWGSDDDEVTWPDIEDYENMTGTEFVSFAADGSWMSDHTKSFEHIDLGDYTAGNSAVTDVRISPYGVYRFTTLNGETFPVGHKTNDNGDDVLVINYYDDYLYVYYSYEYGTWCLGSENVDLSGYIMVFRLESLVDVSYTPLFDDGTTWTGENVDTSIEHVINSEIVESPYNAYRVTADGNEYICLNLGTEYGGTCQYEEPFYLDFDAAEVYKYVDDNNVEKWVATYRNNNGGVIPFSVEALMYN